MSWLWGSAVPRTSAGPLVVSGTTSSGLCRFVGRDHHAGACVADVHQTQSSTTAARPPGERNLLGLRALGPSEEEALPQSNVELDQRGALVLCLDALGNELTASLGREVRKARYQ